MNSVKLRFDGLARMVLLVCCWSVLNFGVLNESSLAFQSDDDRHQQWERLRLLFVPAAELPAVLDGPVQRVVLEQAEVVELLQKLRAQRAEADPNRTPDFRVDGPDHFVWERASYEIELDGEVGRLSGHALGQAFGENLISLPLPWQQGLIHRLVQNGDAPIWHRTGDGSVSLLLSEAGKHQFQVEMTIPVSTDSVRQSIQLRLPQVAVAAMSVKVAGNVDLVSGAAVIERRYDETEHATMFQLAAGSGPCDLIFTLNNRQKQQALIWDSRAFIMADVSRSLDRVQIVVENQILQGQLNQAEWRLADDWEVSQLSGEGVRQWQVLRDEQGPRLQVWFHNGMATRPFVVSAFRQRTAAPELVWESPRWEATTAYRQPRVIEVTTTEDLLVPRMEPTRMDLVPLAIADALRAPFRQNTEATLVRHGAWYGTGPDAAVRVSLRSAEDRFTTTSSHYMLLSSLGLESRSVFRIENQGDLRFAVRLSLPPAYRVQSVSDAQGPLEFQTTSSAEGVDVQVALRTGIGGTVASLLNESPEQSVQTSNVVELIVQSDWVPEDWFANWTTRSLAVRPPSISEAQQTAGILAVGIAPDYTLKSIDAGQMLALGRQELVEADLASLEPNVAFDLGQTNGELKLELTRRIAAVVSQSVAYYQVEPTRSLVRGEWLLDVRNGTQENFRLQLPADAPESALIRVREPNVIRQQTIVAELPGIREIQLTQAVEGRVHFFVDYEVPLANEDKRVLPLEPLRMVDAAWQTQLVSVESHPRLEVRIETSVPKWSVDQLPDTEYQPARRLLGIWDVTDEKVVPIRAEVTQQQTAALPMAVIQSRELFSQLSSSGTLVTGAKYQVKSTAGTLWLQLPDEASLWALSQDGIAQTVQVTDGRIMISFAERTGQQAHDVQLVYAQSNGYDPTSKQLRLAPPTWHFDVTEASASEVPVVKTEWQLEPPPGLDLKWTPTDWSVPGQKKATWFERQGQWLRRQVSYIVGTVATSAQPMNGLTQESFADWSSFSSESVAEPRGNANREQMAAQVDQMMLRMKRMETGDAVHWSYSRAADEDAMDDELTLSELPPGASPPSPAVAGMAGPPQRANGMSGLQGTNRGPSEKTERRVAQDAASPKPGAPARQLQGFRSLQIQAEGDSRDIRFVGLGNKEHLSVQLVDQVWLDLLTFVIGCFAFAAGLMFGRHSFGAWFGWAALVCCLSAVAQWFWSSFPEVAMILERLIWVVVVLLVWRFVGTLFNACLRAFVVVASGFFGFFTRLPSANSVGFGLLLAFGTTAGWGQTFQDNRPGVQVLNVPDAAVVVAYDPDAPQDRVQGKWWVPKAWLDQVREWERATPTSKIKFPPELFLPGGTMELSVANGETLEIRGQFQLQLPSEQTTYLPLQLGSGVLTAAMVEGEPASIVNVIDAVRPPDFASGEKWLRLQGPGIKRFEFRIQYALNRLPGGWQVEGQLPAAVATLATFADLPPESRLTWTAGGISRIWTVPAEGDVSPLGVGADGQFAVRWRAAENQVRVGSAAISHDAEILVRESGVHVASTFDVNSVEPTDEFVVEVPEPWRVEKMEGPNLRAWNPVEGQPGQFLLQFLSSNTKQSFQVGLAGDETFWTRDAVPVNVPLPKVRAEGQRSGSVKIYRSGSLQVAASDTSSLRRTNLEGTRSQAGPWLSWQTDLFGLRPYQAFTWQFDEPTLVLSVARGEAEHNVTHRSVFNFDVATTSFETQITFQSSATPYRRVVLQVPTTLKPQSLTCLSRKDQQLSAVTFQVAKRPGSRPATEEYELRLADFQSDELLVTIQGSLDSTLEKVLNWEPIRVLDAANQEYEYAMTKTDTIDLGLSLLIGAEQVLPDEFKGWLDAERIARLPISLRARNAEHRVDLASRRLPSLVSFESVTDLTVGDRVVEETLLLEWKIDRSGINQVEFLLPSLWRDCQIEGPWIGRVERQPTENQLVQFTVFLQDRIVGDYRLAVSLDRSVPQTDRFATIPQNLTGETRNRWITAQNSGNLELEFVPRRDVVQIQRQRAVFSELQQKIKATYLANAFAVEANATAPELEWRTVPRTVVETRSARVRLSETDLVVDRHGSYIAKQRLQVSNRTQPRLQLQIPVGSQLIQLVVDGQPVQPLAGVGGSEEIVHVPLLKSTELNLDYPIDLIYQGRLDVPGTLQEIAMPLAFTVDVESEVSHLRLHLSEDLRPQQFGGTMSRVVEERVLREEVLEYRIQQLSSFKKSVSNEYMSAAQQSRQRQELQSFLSNNDLVQSANPQALVSEIEELNKVLNDNNTVAVENLGNRANIRGLVAEQKNSSEVKLNKNYSFNFANPLGEMQQQIELGDLEQRPSGQTAEKGKASQNATNSLLSQTYESDAGLQSRSGRKGADQADVAQGPGGLQQAQAGQGLTPALPGSVPPNNQVFNPRNAPPTNLPPTTGRGISGPEVGGTSVGLPGQDGPATEAAPSRLRSGLVVDFAPTGDVYYFRVPRGRPELTVTWASQENYINFWSMWQLLGCAAACWVLMKFSRVIRPRLRNQ